MIKLIEKYPIISLVIFGLIILLPNLDVFVLTIMEARDYVTAHEMVVDGHWLKTTMNGIERYEKPPLPTWLSALSGILFGIHNLFALRLPAALMIIFSAIYIYKLSIKLNFTTERSLINSIILLTSFYIIAIIIEAPWDIFTHGFALASIYYFIDMLKNDKVPWKSVFLSGTFMGFSFLSKGPIGFYALFLPFIVSYIYFFGITNFKSKFKYFLVFLLIFIAIGGSWYLYIEFIDPLRLNKITAHEAENWDSYNVRPFYYYWNFFIQSGIWAILAFVSLCYPYLYKKVKQIKEYKFIILWILISFILLSVIPEKKSRYTVPLLFPLAISTGFYIEYLIHSFSSLKNLKEKIVVYFNFYLFGLIAISLPIGLYLFFKTKTTFHFLNFYAFVLVTFIIGFYIIKSISENDIKKAFYLKVVFYGAILVLGLPFIKLMNNNKTYDDIKNLPAFENKYHVKSYYYKEIAPEIIWYYDGTIDELKQINSIEKDSIGLLINIDDSKIIEEIPSDYKFEKIKQFNGNYFKKERNRLIYNYYLLTKKI